MIMFFTKIPIFTNQITLNLQKTKQTMKKLLLLLVTGSIVVGANAQERLMTSPFQSVAPGGAVKTLSSVKNDIKTSHSATGTARKTTSATDRWYSYVDTYDTTSIDLTGSGVSLTSPYLWNDTLSVDAYSNATGGTTYSHNTTVSMGTILSPQDSSFNNPLYYTGEMQLTPTNSYTLDSIIVFGGYGRNPAKLGVVDTLRISVLYGNGTAGSDIKAVTTTNSTLLTRYGATGSLKYTNIGYDTAKNTPSGTTLVTKTLLLDTAALRLDTSSSGTFVALVTFSPAITIPAGNMVSSTVQFKTGDPAFTAGDTVFSSSFPGGNKYGMFRPYVAHNGTSTAPLFAPYKPTNLNDGVFKTLPDTSHGWTGEYIPTWFWSSSATGSTLQFPYTRYHLNCSSCSAIVDHSAVANTQNINGVRTYPNPANSELMISFNTTTASDVTISLSNTLGQKVFSKTLNHVSSGNTVVNTANLAAGVYLYSITSGQEHTTGQVVIAH
jgi:hypothetical protein